MMAFSKVLNTFLKTILFERLGINDVKSRILGMVNDVRFMTILLSTIEQPPAMARNTSLLLSLRYFLLIALDDASSCSLVRSGFLY